MWFYNLEKKLFAQMDVTSRKKTETKIRFLPEDRSDTLFEITLNEYCWEDSGVFSPDGKQFYFIGDGIRHKENIYNTIYCIDIKNQSIDKFGLCSPAFGCDNISVGKNQVVYFKDESIVISKKDKTIVYEIPFPVGEHHTLTLSPDEKSIAVSNGIDSKSGNFSIQLFSVKSGKLINTIFSKPENSCNDVSISRILLHPDGKTIFALGYYNFFFAFDIENKQNKTKSYSFPSECSDDFICIDISDNGENLLLLKRNCKVLIFNLTSMKALKVFSYPPMMKGLRAAGFIEDDGTRGYYYSNLDDKLEFFSTSDSEGKSTDSEWKETVDSLWNQSIEEEDHAISVQILDKAWRLIPDPKEDHTESYNLAKSMIITCLLLNDLKNAAKWSELIFKCDLERPDDGEREMLAGRVMHASGEIEKSKKYFITAHNKSKGRLFKNEKFKPFLDLIKSSVK